MAAGVLDVPESGAPQVVKPARMRHLDALRGLAVLLMVVDHLAIVFDLLPVRLTVGRVAMPLFFILAGHLATRVGVRTLWALGVGLALPSFAAWVDSPNVLVWYALGVAVLVLSRREHAPFFVRPPFLVAFALTIAANGFGSRYGTGYDPSALLALMALGALVPRASFAWAHRLPAWMALVGRYPLTVYVGHVLALTWLTASL